MKNDSMPLKRCDTGSSGEKAPQSKQQQYTSNYEAGSSDRAPLFQVIIWALCSVTRQENLLV
jgi:hypothetical protein